MTDRPASSYDVRYVYEEEEELSFAGQDHASYPHPNSHSHSPPQRPLHYEYDEPPHRNVHDETYMDEVRHVYEEPYHRHDGNSYEDEIEEELPPRFDEIPGRFFEDGDDGRRRLVHEDRILYGSEDVDLDDDDNDNHNDDGHYDLRYPQDHHPLGNNDLGRDDFDDRGPPHFHGDRTDDEILDFHLVEEEYDEEGEEYHHHDQQQHHHHQHLVEEYDRDRSIEFYDETLRSPQQQHLPHHYDNVNGIPDTPSSYHVVTPPTHTARRGSVGVSPGDHESVVSRASTYYVNGRPSPREAHNGDSTYFMEDDYRDPYINDETQVLSHASFHVGGESPLHDGELQRFRTDGVAGQHVHYPYEEEQRRRGHSGSSRQRRMENESYTATEASGTYISEEDSGSSDDSDACLHKSVVLPQRDLSLYVYEAVRHKVETRSGGRCCCLFFGINRQCLLWGVLMMLGNAAIASYYAGWIPTTRFPQDQEPSSLVETNDVNNNEDRFVYWTLTPTDPPAPKGPTVVPSSPPSYAPTELSSARPTTAPSVIHSALPTRTPTNGPTTEPTVRSSSIPSDKPSRLGTTRPSSQPTDLPTIYLSDPPSLWPTVALTLTPTLFVSDHPSATRGPTGRPTDGPSPRPTPLPTGKPTITSRPSTPAPTRTPDWVAVSTALHGTDYTHSCSLSADGRTLGVLHIEGVTVYRQNKNNNNSWQRLGEHIYPTLLMYESGRTWKGLLTGQGQLVSARITLSLSGETVAWDIAFDDTGRLGLFDYNAAGDWIIRGQVGGYEGSAGGPDYGPSVAYARGIMDRVLVGAWDGTEARVYANDGLTWIQVGDSFAQVVSSAGVGLLLGGLLGGVGGSSTKQQLLLGASVAYSDDGTIAAVAAPHAGNRNHGEVFLYQYDIRTNAWDFMSGTTGNGQYTVKGAMPNSEAGIVALSGDGRILAVGTPHLTLPKVPGQVQFYELTTGGKWERIGTKVSPDNDNDGFGQMLALSGSGRVVAVGSPVTGKVCVYRHSPQQKLWHRHGTCIHHPSASASANANGSSQPQERPLAFSVALSSGGNRVAVGTPGHGVVVYEYGSPP